MLYRPMSKISSLSPHHLSHFLLVSPSTAFFSCSWNPRFFIESGAIKFLRSSHQQPSQGPSSDMFFSPLHPTRQVALTQSPAFVIVHALVAFQALEVLFHNRLTLRLMIQRETPPLRRYRFRKRIPTARRSKCRHGRLYLRSLFCLRLLLHKVKSSPKRQLVRWNPCRRR